MDITDSRSVGASSVPASGAPARRRMSWLQAIGCGALGLVVGYGLAVLATQAPISALPLIDAASAGPAIAPITVDLAGVPSSLPAAPGLEATGSWTAPLPGGMEPCWAERPLVSC